VWFSCGAASAVAAKLAVELYGDGCEIVHCDTLSAEHPDNVRFLRDVERWVGRAIVTIKSDKFASVDDVFWKTKYMAGIAGARCTTEMKKLPRLAFQRPDDIHVFGYTSEEQKRAAGFEDRNPELAVEWVLIVHAVRKATCLDVLREDGIEIPAMYRLGFDHNNCIGCVKATSPKYWNAIRRQFPEAFWRRVYQSRVLGVRLARIGGKRVFLDEIPPDATGPDEDIECGPVCQTPSTEER